jgi:hypothetical protein
MVNFYRKEVIVMEITYAAFVNTTDPPLFSRVVGVFVSAAPLVGTKKLQVTVLTERTLPAS